VLLALAMVGCSTGPAVSEGDGQSCTLDVPVTQFSSYDARLFSDIQRRWHSLLRSSLFKLQHGKVVIAFVLTSDGRISDLKIEENEVGEIQGLLCKRSILDPAPYPRWTDDMRRTIGTSQRKCVLTFNYK
jgi:hypothetical protein